MYNILPIHRSKAKKLGVTIETSKNKNKKIDVYKDGKKVASIGAINYKDYQIYLKEKGKDFANNRKRLYRIRHQKTRTIKGTPSYYADKILW